MSSLTLILGRAGSGKTARVMRAIARAVAEKRPGQLLLVPEQYSHEAEKELCRVCGDGLSLFGEVCSFTRLASLAEEETGRRRPLLDKGGRLLAMLAALGTLEGRLSVFAAAPRRPELLRALLGAVTEFKTALAAPAQLLSAAEQLGGELGEKLRELALISEAYDAVSARGRADPFDRLTRLAQLLPQTSVGRGGHIYIDGFSDFTAQELAVVLALLRQGADLSVCLTLDDLRGGSELFLPARRTALRLKAEAEAMGLPVRIETLAPEPETDTRAPALRFLEQKLFDYSPAPCPPVSGALRLFRAPDENAECALAAALCTELVRASGCRWRDISVVARGFEHYRQALQSAFDYYGAPLWLGRRAAVDETPLPRFLSGCFEVLSGGWDCQTVLDWLKTGLCDAAPEELDELENYALQWDLRGGIWTREAPWTLSPAGFSEGAESPEAKEKLASLDALRRRLCLPLKRYAEAAEAADTAEGQARAFADFLAEMRLPETLSRRAAELRERALAGEAETFSQLWELLVGALEQFALTLGDTPMDRARFGALLEAVLAQYDVGAIPAVLDAVTAGDLERMRRRSLKHLIVLGASDERLPAPEADSPLLSAAEREKLAALGLALSDPRGDGLYRELALIYNAFSLPAETLTLVCPERGEDGPARPSLVFSRAAALTGVSVEPFDRAAVMACAPAPALELAAEDSGGLSAAARAYFAQKPDYAARLRALSAARGRTARGSLSPESVRALYGATPRVSATRAENFSDCAYADFLKYGLRAKKRRKADFDPPELGKFMHYVLENVCRAAGEAGGFAALPPERRDALTDEYVEKYVHEVLADFRDKSERFVYLFRRLTVSVRRVVADMAEELSRGEFRPLDFELDLAQMGVTLSDGEASVRVTGVADRVDGWLHDGKLWLRVVDYKTGKKAFSLSDVWYGAGLQMLLYLFTLEKTGEKRYGLPVESAGVLYVPARDDLLRADAPVTAEEAAAERAKKLRRSGLLLHDDALLAAMERGDTKRFLPIKTKDGVPVDGDSLCRREQLGRLAKHVEDVLLALAKELRGGRIEAAPAWRGASDNACLRCDYREVCRFDPAKDRKNRRYKLPAAEVWEKLAAD